MKAKTKEPAKKPPSVLPSIKIEVNKLAKLLDSPQPGDVFWVIAYGNAMTRLVELWQGKPEKSRRKRSSKGP